MVTRVGDMGDLSYAKSLLSDLNVGGRLDGLILNHGTLGACLRIGNMDGEDWEKTFRVNVSSCVILVSVFPGTDALHTF